jgi:predicted metal-dependent peptidase
MNQIESLAKAAKHLMLEEPFYGLFLIMLNRKISEQVPTAGVSISGISYNLLVNPQFWDSLTPEQRKGILKHELLHIGFFHLTNYDHLTNHEIRNIAMDLEINQYINRDWLPEGGMFLDTFPELNLKPKMGTLHYYDELMKAAQNGSCSNLNYILDAMNQGNCKVKVTTGRGDLEADCPNHDWEPDESDKPLNEAERKLLNKHTETILRELKDQVEKSRGTVPGEFASILEKLDHIEPSKFDWRGYLRRYTGGSTKVYTKKTRRKFNKRYEENPGLKIKQRKHILVAIDTSGSVNKEELLEFMREIHHIHKTGADVTVVHADAAIQHIAPYNPREEYKIYGRGGTDFNPVVDYYSENHTKYSCLVYLTDGECSAPDKKPGKMLWVLSSTSNKTDHLPGATIQLN